MKNEKKNKNHKQSWIQVFADFISQSYCICCDYPPPTDLTDLKEIKNYSKRQGRERTFIQNSSPQSTSSLSLLSTITETFVITSSQTFFIPQNAVGTILVSFSGGGGGGGGSGQPSRGANGGSAGGGGGGGSGQVVNVSFSAQQVSSITVSIGLGGGGGTPGQSGGVGQQTQIFLDNNSSSILFALGGTG